MKEKLTIKQLEPDYRPDEKFLKYGPAALTSAELLAIILRTGSDKEHSVDLARRILYSEISREENILNIFNWEIADLLKLRGVGTVKALQVKAIGELSKRIAVSTTGSRLSFTEPETIAQYYMEQLRHMKQENVVLLMLNSSCELIKEKFISKGTVNASLLSPREIFIEALRYEAVNIILLHNHPSGSPKPSKADIIGTKTVLEGGRLVGISLLDHIIIGDCVFCSMREEGYLND